MTKYLTPIINGYLPLSELELEDRIPRTKIHRQYVSNLTGQRDSSIPWQAAHGVAPLVATAHELQLPEFRQLLESRHLGLSALRWGKLEQVHRRVWGKFSQTVKGAPSGLELHGYPREAEYLRTAMRELPITLIDYAYYTNLTLHWTAHIANSTILLSENEIPVYWEKVRRGAGSFEVGMGEAILEFVSLPVVPQLQYLDVATLMDLRRTLRPLRTRFMEHLSTKVRSSESESSSEFIEWIRREMASRILDAAKRKTSRTRNILEGVAGVVITIGGVMFPPLSGLGFIGPAKKVYDAFSADPVVAMVIALSKERRSNA